MLVNEDWIAIFDHYKIGVEVSLDGLKKYNDLAKLDKRGQSTHERVITRHKEAKTKKDQGISNVASVLVAAFVVLWLFAR